ncbi:serine hydrolase FSH [Nemania sp. NC0429]|nr:serine hydrolase FSH [Nemania sp. NC0429]
MKILCLHGCAQSGQVFQAQLGAAIGIVESSRTGVSFDFIDTPTQCVEFSINERAIYKAHEWLATKLEGDGPYDGVIGFSQGAALISSYLLYHQWYNHEHDPPFRFATFISGSISLAVLKNLGVPVPRAAERVVEEMDLRRRENLGPLPSHASLARQAMFNSDDCFGLNLNKVPLELKIRIPTVHIWGTEDPGFPAAIHLAGLCDPYIRKIYAHDGAHKVPQGKEDTEQLSQLVLWYMQQAIWPGDLPAWTNIVSRLSKSSTNP